MSLDKATVQNIAHLARIRVEDERLDTMVGELNSILGWVEQLSEVDTDGIPPLASVTGHGLPMRADEVTEGDLSEKVLANAPDPAGQFYSVPKVID